MVNSSTGQLTLECLSENHIFHLYVNLMYRTAQKSELMVHEDPKDKQQYMNLSLSYYSALVKLFFTMNEMLQATNKS